MWYVYILAASVSRQEYIGATADLKRRLREAQCRKSPRTPRNSNLGELIWYCAFRDKHRALAFEKYLKSHSGRAFAKKRL